MPKILIVEDNELNLKLFEDLLSFQGFEVLSNTDGVGAFDMAKEHQPDIILMDIHLPDISGLDITRQLREDDATKNIPVVAVTAFAMKGDREKILDSGCQDYISKPVTSIPDFISTIKKYL